MPSRSTLLHLRLPFSFFLLPIFIFAASLSPHLVVWKTALAFFILHFLLYPASNAYNSYYDKDEESIGGLEKPPPVSRELLHAAWLLDGAALLLGLLLGWAFVAALFVYGLVSKLYSHDRVRLKKYAVASWLTASFFQGAFTFLMTYQAINGLTVNEMTLLPGSVLWAALLSTLFLGGSYPMTQVYQHAEDARRGDHTLSRLLGIRGTFVFAAVAFQFSAAGFWLFFRQYYSGWYFGWFVLCLLPGLLHFAGWFAKVWQNERAAAFRPTMRLNWLTATGLNVFFLILGMLVR